MSPRVPALGYFVDDRSQVSIDLPRLLETRLLLQANSGGGKSWALRRLLEQTAGQVQQLVIDPEGEFATLREHYDFVIAAAHDGDALAHPRTAAILARRLLETGVSAILDIYDLKAHERQSFVRQFLDALTNAPKALWRPCLVVLDEAHVFCPEAGKAESAGAVIDLATRGRKRGFCLVAATQRLAKLHKDAAAELLNKLIGRTGLDVDVRRAADELGMTPKEAVANLRNLQAGDFYAFGPALSLAVQKITVGPVRTTHPKAGDRVLKAPPKPTAAIVAVLPKLADLPKEAEVEARTIADLQRELAQSRRALIFAEKTKGGASKGDLQVAESRGFERGLTEGKRAAAAYLKTLKASLHQAVESAIAGTPPPQLVTPVSAAVVPAKAAPTPRQRTEAAPTNGNGSLAKAERLVLTALAQYPDGRTKVQVALLTGYAHTGGGFNNAIGSLRSRGYLDGDANRMTITAEGQSALGHFEPLPLGAALLDHWRASLPKAERAALDVIVEAYPNSIGKEEVAQAAGYNATGGGFNNALGKLRTLELITGRGELRASEDLFA